MRRLLFVLLAVSMAATTLIAAGTVVVTTTTDIGVPGYVRVTAAWTSADDGTVTGNAFAMPGLLRQITFLPGSGGTQPTDLYDMTITTSNGNDILLRESTSYGANLSNATPLTLQFDPPLIIDADRTLDVRITNAGNAKTGSVVFWLQR